MDLDTLLLVGCRASHVLIDADALVMLPIDCVAEKLLGLLLVSFDGVIYFDKNNISSHHHVQHASPRWNHAIMQFFHCAASHNNRLLLTDPNTRVQQLRLPGVNKHQPRCSTKRPQPPLLTPLNERTPHRSLHQAGHHSHGLTFTEDPRDLFFYFTPAHLHNN